MAAYPKAKFDPKAFGMYCDCLFTVQCQVPSPALVRLYLWSTSISYVRSDLARLIYFIDKRLTWRGDELLAFFNKIAHEHNFHPIYDFEMWYLIKMADLHDQVGKLSLLWVAVLARLGVASKVLRHILCCTKYPCANHQRCQTTNSP